MFIKSDSLSPAYRLPVLVYSTSAHKNLIDYIADAGAFHYVFPFNASSSTLRRPINGHIVNDFHHGAECYYPIVTTSQIGSNPLNSVNYLLRGYREDVLEAHLILLITILILAIMVELKKSKTTNYFTSSLFC